MTHILAKTYPHNLPILILSNVRELVTERKRKSGRAGSRLEPASCCVGQREVTKIGEV